MFRFLTKEEIESLPKITANSLEDLFSQEVFGPVVPYTCKCGIYKRVRFSSGVVTRCPTCKTELTTNFKRRREFARIELPIGVINPIILELLPRSVKELVMRAIERNVEVEYNGKVYKPQLEEIVSLIKTWMSDYPKHPVSKLLQEQPDVLLVHNLIVLPPDLRPMIKIKKERMLDELNQKYFKILEFLKRTEEVSDHLIVDSLRSTVFTELQKSLIDFYDYIFERLGKKTGIIRGNILGKRVDFSGRAVIAPGPELRLDECGLPYFLLVEALKPQIIRRLVNKKIYSSLYAALNAVDKSLSDCSYEFYPIVEELCDEGLYCVLNRQPSLHRYSVLSFRVRPYKSYTIRLHPLLCAPFNADFDGDAMAVYFPLKSESIEEVKTKLSPVANLVSVSNFKSIVTASQDIVLGIYLLTQDKPGSKKVQYKGVEMTEGQKVFNETLPEDYKPITKAVDKKLLHEIIDDISLNYPPEVSKKTFDAIMDLGFDSSLKYGCTLSLSDIYDPELIRLTREKIKEENSVEENLRILQIDPELNERAKSLPVALFVESGSRGSWDQLRQLIMTRCYIADMSNRVKTLVKSCFVTGLTREEFFNSCYGTRKVLLDTAFSTGDSGYLTRQMIYSTVFAELSENVSDCQTTDYLELFIEDDEGKKKIDCLLGRYYLDEESGKLKVVNKNTFNKVKGKTIKLRSPIYCKGKDICHVCYGNLSKLLHSKYIGIVASQAIGERATQLVLRTFHVSGAIQKVSSGKDENKDIINGLMLLKTMLHKTEELKDKSPAEMVNLLFDILSEFGNIHLVHFETLVSCMMWSDQKLWRTLKDRDKHQFRYVSTLTVPKLYSGMLGFAFCNPKSHLLKMVLDYYLETEDDKKERKEDLISLLLK